MIYKEIYSNVLKLFNHDSIEKKPRGISKGRNRANLKITIFRLIFGKRVSGGPGNEQNPQMEKTNTGSRYRFAVYKESGITAPHIEYILNAAGNPAAFCFRDYCLKFSI